jgi:glycerol uptake facilitator-like aquaporin
MLFAKGDLDASTFIGYVIAQVLGGLAALAFYNSTLGMK